MSEEQTLDAGVTPAAPATRHISVEALEGRFAEALLRYETQAGDQQVVYLDSARSLEVLEWLKDDPDQKYDLLVDVTAVDYGGGKPLEMVYQLWSITHRRALRVKCELPLDALTIPSVAGLWHSADWLEREVYDLFGIDFPGHPDLRRILMPENYAEGHPLRKDFPLRGRFTRAEQTRRAMVQDVESYYPETDLVAGGDPQVVPGPEGPDTAPGEEV